MCCDVNVVTSHCLHIVAVNTRLTVSEPSQCSRLQLVAMTLQSDTTEQTRARGETSVLMYSYWQISVY